MRRLNVLEILFFTALCSGVQLLAQNNILVVEGGTLIDGTGRNPISNAVIVVEGSRIRAVGSKGEVSYPSNAKVIRVDGKTILPGLIDPHVHILNDWMLQMFLPYGITTVADTNNYADWILMQKDALNRGKIKGPRMFVAGLAVGGPDSEVIIDRNVPTKTVEETRVYVRNMVARGVDMIKVNAHLTPDQLKAVVEEAAKAGLPVVGHTRNIREATLLGMKFMEHTDPLATAIFEEMGPATLKEVKEKGIASPEYLMDTKLFDPLIQLMVKEGVFINPTFVGRFGGASPRQKEWTDLAAAMIKDPAALQFVPADVRKSWTQAARRPPAEGSLRKVEEFTRKYVEAGGKIVAGSDAYGGDGYVPGLSTHYEMEMTADSGVPPMKTILSATKWAAEVMGKDKELGTIEVGKVADIIVVDGNPLRDITATQKLHLVIKDGQVVDTAYNPSFVNPLPRPGGEGRPKLSRIVTPTIAREGDQSASLQIEGSGFNPKSLVRFDTIDLKTQFVSDSKLNAVADEKSLRTPGSYAVTVVNPGSGGGTSEALYFIVGFRK